MIIDRIPRMCGNSGLSIALENSKVQQVELRPKASPRLFESLICGKPHVEAHLILQRICGVCSVSHTLGSLMAIENALAVRASDQTKALRELMEIGSYLQSHSEHLYVFSLPDYYGYADPVEMAAKFSKDVSRGLSLTKLGREICRTIGGRSMHPVTTAVGGFLKLPTQAELEGLHKSLEKGKNDAYRTAELFSSLNYPRFKRPTEYVSLKTEDHYPLMGGNLMFSNGLEARQDRYANYLKEADGFSLFERRPYYVGALARINNNTDLLSKNAQKCLEKFSIKFPSYNPFHNNYAQAIESVHVIDRALEILKALKVQDEPLVAHLRRTGRGIVILEAPRGLLIYDITVVNGSVSKAVILTPTQQSHKNIELDVKKYYPRLMSFADDQIRLEVEKLVRSYDPCMVCAVH
jgi:sulfhydrogenase subunit alpha